MRPTTTWLSAGLVSAWLLALMLGIFFTATLGQPSSAAAQSSENAAAKTAEKTPADKPADAPESLLHWLTRTLGFRYVVIFLFLTVNLVALMVMNTLAVWRDNVVPPALIQSLQNRLDGKRYQEASELLKGDQSLLAKVLAAGVARLPAGPGASPDCETAMAAMQELGSHEAMKMEQRLGYVSLIAKLAPLFGLLGTVDGMVMAFERISHTDIAPRPSDLAPGIGTALVATIVGLWISIAAIAFHHIVRNRMNRLVSEAGIVAEELLNRFAKRA